MHSMLRSVCLVACLLPTFGTAAPRTVDSAIENTVASFVAALQSKDWEKATEYIRPIDLERLAAARERRDAVEHEVFERGAGYWEADPTHDASPAATLAKHLELLPGLPSLEAALGGYRILAAVQHEREAFVVLEVWADQQDQPQLRILPLQKHDGAWRVNIEYALGNCERGTAYLQMFVAGD